MGGKLIIQIIRMLINIILSRFRTENKTCKMQDLLFYWRTPLLSLRFVILCKAPPKWPDSYIFKYSVKSCYVTHFALPGYMTKFHRVLKWSKYAVRTSAEVYPNGFGKTCKCLFMRHWRLVMCTGNTGVLVQSVLPYRRKRRLEETKEGKTARNKPIYVECTTM
jgi:hypothetical protein